MINRNVLKYFCKYYFIINIFLLIISCDTGKKNSDDYYEKCRKLVLSENKIGEEFFFSKKGVEIDEFTISYLGEIHTLKNDTLKIINFQNKFGYREESKHGSSSFYIYDQKNDLIGHYLLGNYWAVPQAVDAKGNLIFSYNNDFCHQTTRISFKDSIPKKLFIPCTMNGGDLYNLETP